MVTKLLVVFKDGSELIVKDVKCCYLSTYRIKGIRHFQHKSALRVIKNSGNSFINWDEVRYCRRINKGGKYHGEMFYYK